MRRALSLSAASLPALLFATALFAGAAQAQTPTDPAGKGARPEAPATPDAPRLDNRRFGVVPDPAYGAFQRGLYITALNLARPKAEAGDAAAQTLVAEIYSRGLGVKQDQKEAAKWYRLAAEQGVAEAQFQYALMLRSGHFVPRDADQAFALMEDSANAGNMLAQFNFAQMVLERGHDTIAIDRAVSYYERAADKGLADAQYAMAQTLANGAGSHQKDLAAARRWLERAAQQNFDSAQLDLGTWLVQGIGGPADTKAGFAWLRRAAEGGNVAARNRVAKLYMAGIGIEPDSIEAAGWYLSARRAGLVDPEMDDFLEGLTDAQLADAAKRADARL